MVAAGCSGVASPAEGDAASETTSAAVTEGSGAGEVLDGTAVETDPTADVPDGLAPEDIATPSDPAASEPDDIEVGEPEPVNQLTPEEILAFEPPPVADPDEALPAAEEKATEIEEAADDDATDILEASPVEIEPTAEEVASFRDGLARTPSGRLISLDESAALACAHVEMAIWALDDADAEAAAGHLTEAADWATDSATPGLDEWIPVLAGQATAADIDPVALVAFIETCVAAGYDI